MSDDTTREGMDQFGKRPLSRRTFVKAGEDNPKLAKIQHGFYVMKSHMSGASAVDRITAPASRVGQLEIRPYTQFDDITQPEPLSGNVHRHRPIVPPSLRGSGRPT